MERRTGAPETMLISFMIADAGLIFLRQEEMWQPGQSTLLQVLLSISSMILGCVRVSLSTLGCLRADLVCTAQHQLPVLQRAGDGRDEGRRAEQE